MYTHWDRYLEKVLPLSLAIQTSMHEKIYALPLTAKLPTDRQSVPHFRGLTVSACVVARALVRVQMHRGPNRQVSSSSSQSLLSAEPNLTRDAHVQAVENDCHLRFNLSLILFVSCKSRINTALRTKSAQPETRIDEETDVPKPVPSEEKYAQFKEQRGG